MRYLPVLLASGLGLSYPALEAQANNPNLIKKAQESAVKYLALVDSGKLTESWSATSAYLRSQVKKEDYIKKLKTTLAPFGKVKSRQIKSSQYLTTLPGAPDGKYVVTQFNTVFANKSKAVETVTTMLEPDQTWRVAGYFIK